MFQRHYKTFLLCADRKLTSDKTLVVGVGEHLGLEELDGATLLRSAKPYWGALNKGFVFCISESSYTCSYPVGGRPGVQPVGCEL